MYGAKKAKSDGQRCKKKNEEIAARWTEGVRVRILNR